jgi:hypothetical protein
MRARYRLAPKKQAVVLDFFPAFAKGGDMLVHLAVDAGIATITLDSPHNRNALAP